jgi:MFS family permease
MVLSKLSTSSNRIYYGWWIVLATFLNLFFAVGIIFYGFPVLYPYFIESLAFTRAQVTQGFFLGFLFAGLPIGVLAGALIDRFGARLVILAGVGLVALPLLFMGMMNRFWQFESLCIVEVIGYVLAGPIANQVLIARWFHRRRGRAMGYAYLGLGLGGVTAPMLVNFLARYLGWRHALELLGALILVVLLPVRHGSNLIVVDNEDRTVGPPHRHVGVGEVDDLPPDRFVGATVHFRRICDYKFAVYGFFAEHKQLPFA